MKEITLQIPEGKKAEWVNGVLTLVDEKDTRPVTERIKTFHDAYCELGNEHPFVKSYEKYVNTAGGEEQDVIAYLKLRIIVAALNEGWEPKFTLGEYRWFPWYWLKTKEEIEALSEEEKQHAVCRSNGSANAFGGLVCSHASYASSNSSTNIGTRLAFKSEELADYAEGQFREIYADFCFRSE